MKTTRHNLKRPRRGLTLIELLVVVFIILAVSAAVVPVLAPTAAGRRQREAARVISTFISGARTRAIEIGRPAGIWLQGTTGDRGSVVTLSYCEVPAPYSGETINTKIMYNVVNRELHVTDIAVWNAMTSKWNPLAPIGFILPGDLITLNNRSTTFVISGAVGGTLDANGFLQDPQTDSWVLNPTSPAMMMYDSSGNNLIYPAAPKNVNPNPNDGVAFQIFRQPRKSAGASIELPPGTAIDLYYSGDDRSSLLPRSNSAVNYYDGNDTALNATSTSGIVGHNEPVILLFGSNGTPDSVFRLSVLINNPPAAFADLQWGGTAMTRPLYLMIGKAEKVDAQADPFLPPSDDLSSNLIDPANYWVSINPHTGAVSTDPVPVVDQITGGPTVFQLVQRSRAFAIEKLGIGGR